ncbi:MAG: isocitrate/isopropylmalate family dehydrogenase [Myxococcota bacterium]|nr:isocitrate/isopropylmalate family dehydrogenase [Myxococcota bacterium]
MHKVTLSPGDWIGPELCTVVQHVVKKVGVDIDWDIQPMLKGEITDSLLSSCRATGLVFKSRVDAPRQVGVLPPTLELRKQLGVWCSVRPIRALPNVGAKHPNIDIVVIREVSEDIYSGLEHEVTKDVYEAVKITTPSACEKISRYAYQYTVENGRDFESWMLDPDTGAWVPEMIKDPETGEEKSKKRKRLTIVHKSNIMKKSDGLFLNTARKIGEEYKDTVETWDSIADALCTNLVRTPEKFNVLLTGNLFGDIVSDLCSGLAGGITASPSISYGSFEDKPIVVFENLHGKVPELVGTDQYNPIPMLNVLIHLLRHIEEERAADKIEAGIRTLLQRGIKTKDLGGTTLCSEFVERLIEQF